MCADYQQYPFAKGRLPSGWIETTVGEVMLEIRSGYSSGKHNQFGQGIPHLRPMNISPVGEILMEDVRYVSQHAGSLRLAKNDVLFTNTSSTIWVGKTAVVYNPSDWGYSNHMTRLRVVDGISPEFVARQIHCLCLNGYFAFHCKKYINQSSISGKQLAERVPLRLAPANEQKRITAKLSRLLERESNLSGQLNSLQSLIQQYRTNILEAACGGRLVPTEAVIARKECRRYETIAELLQHTSPPPKPNRFAGRNQEVLDTGHPVLCVGNPNRKLPKGWEWTPLVAIAKMESGHTPSRSHPEWWRGEVPWIGIVDARENHGRVIRETIQHINEAGLKNSAARLLPTGTVCVSRTASVGYVVVTGCPMATSQDFINWSPTTAVLSGWLKLAFMTNREALMRFGKGAIHTTIYYPEWSSMHIALPPLREQERIVKEVESRLAAVDRLSAYLLTAIEHTAQLRSSLFYSAFSGTLVAQSQRDEPASVLIEKITIRKLKWKEQEKKGTKKLMRRKTPIKSSRRELLDVLSDHVDGITPDLLMTEAGYATDEVPDFYKALLKIEKNIHEVRSERKVVILKRRR